jgi:hypothetical protein
MMDKIQLQILLERSDRILQQQVYAIEIGLGAVLGRFSTKEKSKATKQT